MKVICIDNAQHINTAIPVIPVGEVVTVIDSHKHDGKLWYQFAEYPPVYYCGGLVRCNYYSMDFAILPDTPADEMQEQEKEAIVNIEHAIV